MNSRATSAAAVARSTVRLLVFVVVLGSVACERERATPKPPPAPPAPTKLDPVTAARAEFDLVSPDLRMGTSKAYSRSELLPNGMMNEAAFDEGDFLGRARTLFGPPNARDASSWVLRHKQTGLIVTMYAGDSGPSYGAVASNAPRLTTEAIAADPILAKGPPQATGVMTAEETTAYWAKYQAYVRHMDDVTAGPALAGAIARLDELISEVSPADWETTYYYDETPSVIHIGAKSGMSFDDELEPAAAMEWLLSRTSATADTEWQTYYDQAVLDFVRTQPHLKATYRAAIERSLARFEAAAATQSDRKLRTLMIEEARELRATLH